jgi:DNA-binding YbaB/EbfC family protein
MNINPFDLLKNAQKIEARVGTFQEKINKITATGVAGGGMVEIDLDGKMGVLAVRIAPEAVESGDIEMLQDLVMAAFTSGLDKVKEEINREMRSMAGNLDISNLPGFLGPQ